MRKYRCTPVPYVQYDAKESRFVSCDRLATFFVLQETELQHYLLVVEYSAQQHKTSAFYATKSQ